jgi:hypothetical protein
VACSGFGTSFGPGNKKLHIIKIKKESAIAISNLVCSIILSKFEAFVSKIALSFAEPLQRIFLVRCFTI